MKRTELKRKTEMARTEFKRHGELARSELKRRRKPRPPEGPLSPAEWRKQVFLLARSDPRDPSGGWCVITRSRARDADDRRFHAHHPLPKSELRKRGYFNRVYDARNGLWCARRVHLRHEYPFDDESRIPRSALPASVWVFCSELDDLEGTQWATELVFRLHPDR